MTEKGSGESLNLKLIIYKQTGTIVKLKAQCDELERKLKEKEKGPQQENTKLALIVEMTKEQLRQVVNESQRMEKHAKKLSDDKKRYQARLQTARKELEKARERSRGLELSVMDYRNKNFPEQLEMLKNRLNEEKERHKKETSVLKQRIETTLNDVKNGQEVISNQDLQILQLKTFQNKARKKMDEMRERIQSQKKQIKEKRSVLEGSVTTTREVSLGEENKFLLSRVHEMEVQVSDIKEKMTDQDEELKASKLQTESMRLKAEEEKRKTAKFEKDNFHLLTRLSHLEVGSTDTKPKAKPIREKPDQVSSIISLYEPDLEEEEKKEKTLYPDMHWTSDDDEKKGETEELEIIDDLVVELEEPVVSSGEVFCCTISEDKSKHHVLKRRPPKEEMYRWIKMPECDHYYCRPHVLEILKEENPNKFPIFCTECWKNKKPSDDKKVFSDTDLKKHFPQFFEQNGKVETDYLRSVIRFAIMRSQRKQK